MTNLLRFAIERTYRGIMPSRTITAPLPEDVAQDPDKLLLDQRDEYFAQSAATRDGVLAEYICKATAPCGHQLTKDC